MSEDVFTERHPAIADEILRCQVGSVALGTNLPGTNDQDYAGVAVERPEFVFGLTHFETHRYRSAAVREGDANARSGPGDVDLEVHSLREFASLAYKGNPSILTTLYSPYSTCSIEGALLHESASLFAAKSAANQFLGYMRAQRERLQGLRGGKDVNRPELVEKYGYDTKYAYHMLRLGFQGCELMQTGRIQIPCNESVRMLLHMVRTGQLTKEKAIATGLDIERELEAARDASRLPARPDKHAIDQLVQQLYLNVWRRLDLI